MICSGCKWHDEYTWACSNGDSPYRADFVNDCCEYYERDEDGQDRKVKAGKPSNADT